MFVQELFSLDEDDNVCSVVGPIVHNILSYSFTYLEWPHMLILCFECLLFRILYAAYFSDGANIYLQNIRGEWSVESVRFALAAV